MAGKVKFTCEKLQMTATLNSSSTAAAVLGALPVDGLAQTSGGWIYFPVPLSLPEENATDEVTTGAVAYWPAGSAVCVFFGGQPPTPVNVIGSLNGNAMQWRNVMFGTPIRMEKA